MATPKFWSKRTAISWALTPFSWLYTGGWLAYLGIYRLGLKRAKHPHQPILCIGNLRVGGTGKTPFVVYVVGLLREAGFKVVVGASGYGSPASEMATVASAGELDPARWGDEPALMRSLVDVPLIIGRNRVRAAELCQESFPDHVLVMDDGFQHLPLAKDLTIILDPEPVPNPACFPAGPYREPRWCRTRADLCLPGQFQVVRSNLLVNSLSGDEVAKQINLAICALAQPENFFNSLRDSGFVAHQELALNDHDPCTAPDLFGKLAAGSTVICTAKDWVKIKRRADVAQYKWLIADYTVRVEPEEQFKAWLIEELGKKSGAISKVP